MIIINESTYLANIVKRYSHIDKNIKLLSTKGFIYDYLVNGDKVEYHIKDKNFYNYLQQFKNRNEIFIIATDHDYAGHLIALELLNILKNEKVYRFKYPFEILMGRNITESLLLKNSSTKFEYGQAKLYLQNREFDKNYNKKRLKALAYLASGEPIKSFKIKK